MKKLKLVIAGIIGIYIITFMYQQHRTILEYRQIPYYSLELLASPIAEVIEFHENADNYEEDERKEMLGNINVRFSTIFNKTGVGLSTEQKIHDRYFYKYNEARIDFALSFDKYMEATTREQREQAYRELKSEYSDYQTFLQLAEDDLMLPDPTLE